ncbi:MAG: hypothetical protein ABJB98_09485 [Actinomycetota bacterium]
MNHPLVDARGQLGDLAPLVRRLVGLDPVGLVRIRLDATSVSALARLPFRVLVGRTVRAVWPYQLVDIAVSTTDLLGWLDRDRPDPPATRDLEWRSATPPRAGWQRLELIPDDVVRPLVRQGALALKEAAARAGVPGGEPRAAVSDALLDAPVLHITPMQQATAAPVEVSLRALSAIVRMGFVPRGSQVGVDVSGRWIRLAGEYGSGFVERSGGALSLLN